MALSACFATFFISLPLSPARLPPPTTKLPFLPNSTQNYPSKRFSAKSTPTFYLPSKSLYKVPKFASVIHLKQAMPNASDLAQRNFFLSTPNYQANRKGSKFSPTFHLPNKSSKQIRTF